MTTINTNTLKLTLAALVATLATAFAAAGINHSTGSVRADSGSQIVASQQDNASHNA